jgi:NAD+ kinase
MSDLPFSRVALVVHPTRDIDNAVATIERWTAHEGLDLVQLPAQGNTRVVADAGEVSSADLVVALGGDGTVLAALRAAAGTDTPVLGVACGSLGAMSAVAAEELDQALDRFKEGDWTTRALPALTVESDAGADWAANDFVIVRRGAGQVTADVSVDDELYVRLAGDGVVVATPLGSSAYTMAAGGPIAVAGAPVYLCTPVAMHGGSAAPLVVPADARLTVDVRPGFAGYVIEVDGQRRHATAASYRFALEPDRLRLVTFDRSGHGLTALRRRGVLADSPRILARDVRELAE